MRKTIQAFIITFLSYSSLINVFAQGQNPVVIGGVGDGSSLRRVITTGVPFLSISPDARSGAMGDVGVATSPSANATHWNPAKLAFLEMNTGFSVSHTPWLSQVVNDMFISYLSGYRKINQEQALAVSLRYFNLGDIQLTDRQGNLLNLVSPREFALAGTFAMQLGENLSAGLTGRFIHSNLLAGASSGSSAGDARPGVSGAADIAVYYTKDAVVNGNEANISFGANISNIGAKITYLDEESADFLPTNLRIGTAYTTNLDPFNKITFAVDFNKLLVPTPPIYAADSNGVIIRENPNDPESDPVIVRGKDPNRGLLAGMFGSFTDAPDGFKEELQEVMVAFGVEYWYNDLFAVRGGYFYENQYKGNRKYFTAGLGLRYQVFGVDFAYLFAQGQNNPLQETLRVSLHFNFNTERQESILEEN